MINNKYKEIINKTSVKERIEAPVIEDIINKTFLEIRKAMARPDYPSILINKFIKFKPNRMVIKNTLEKTHRFYESNDYAAIRNKDHRDELLTKIGGYIRMCNEEKNACNKRISEKVLEFKSKLESLCL